MYMQVRELDFKVCALELFTCDFAKAQDKKESLLHIHATNGVRVYTGHYHYVCTTVAGS